MIELANGNILGVYVIMCSKYKSIGTHGIYPKLVVWPKNKDFYFANWISSHKDSLVSLSTFDSKESANKWIAKNYY